MELMADYFTAKDFMSAAEKSSVHRFCEKALERLKPGDRRLPQIARLRGMLGRGLAVHHAGAPSLPTSSSPTGFPTNHGLKPFAALCSYDVHTHDDTISFTVANEVAHALFKSGIILACYNKPYPAACWTSTDCPA